MIAGIREARPDELATLTRIAHDAKRHWGYPERWIRAWRRDLSVGAEELQSLQVFVAQDEGGRILGFAALRCDEGRACDLEHLWVDPPAMGAGVGRALFEEALRRARAQGASSLRIDSDPHAAGFYARCGAVLCGEMEAPVDGTPRRRPQYRYQL